MQIPEIGPGLDNIKCGEQIDIQAKYAGYLARQESDINKLKSLVDIDKRLTLLEDALVGLKEWRHINPRTLRDKITYILRNEKKPLHFGKISETGNFFKN